MHQGYLDFDGRRRDEPSVKPRRGAGRYVYGTDAAPATDGRTSGDAAAAIRPALSARRAAVYAALLSQGPVMLPDASGAVSGGATAEELESLSGLPGNTVRPRLLDLEAQGYARRTGWTRPTRGGNQATVWEAIP